MVLIFFTIIVMLSSHAIGSLQCDEPSRTTPLAGRLAAIQGLKAGGNDGDDQALFDRVDDKQRAVGEEKMEVKEKIEEKEGAKVTEKKRK